MKRDKIVVLFSGGCDSTLATAIAAERFREIYLITYKRLGIFRTTAALQKLEKLRRGYNHNNSDIKFHFEIIEIDKFFKEICYEHYLFNIIKFGFKILSVCGLCKLAMHWRTILYCLDNNISYVYDGAVEKSNVFPAQNREIMIDRLKKLYLYFGISYSNPIYEIKDVELELYKRDLTPTKKIRHTERDIQPMCIDNLLFSRFINYYLGTYSWGDYVEGLAAFYAYKIDYVKKRIEQRQGVRDVYY